MRFVAKYLFALGIGLGVATPTISFADTLTGSGKLAPGASVIIVDRRKDDYPTKCRYTVNIENASGNNTPIVVVIGLVPGANVESVATLEKSENNVFVGRRLISALNATTNNQEAFVRWSVKEVDCS